MKIPYRTAMLELRVSSISEETELRVASLVKGLAVEQGLLQAFWVEGGLLLDDGGTSAEANLNTIAPSLVAPCAQPRATATALFADHTSE